MPRKKQNMDETDPNDLRNKKHSPAMSPERREQQMILLAYDAAEERIRNGTASSAEIVHFLKLGSSKERLEQEDKRRDIELKSAKTEAIQSAQRIEALYSEALMAMKKYSGQEETLDEA